MAKRRTHHEVLFQPRSLRLEFDPQGDSASPWLALCPHTFRNCTFTIRAERGFRSDLASVPRLPLWIGTWLVTQQIAAALGSWWALVLGAAMVSFTGWLVSPFGNHQRAAFFHDLAYRQQHCSRRVADTIFREIMERDGVPRVRAIALHWAVRVFGWHAWAKNRRRLETLTESIA